MPTVIPKLDKNFIENLPRLSLQEIAFEVSRTLLSDDIPEADLRTIVNEAINFDAPLVPLNDGTFVLELFHGPSLAFKDFGARFMSRIMGYLSSGKEQELQVLVATSGDTGGAVALGFLGVPNTRVTILFPKGKVSEIQELQLCSNGQNIEAVEINGTFDDCQALVKLAFNDGSLTDKLRLTSANSINIARLIPQTFYYFYAYSQALAKGYKEIAFSVPSGNFGNIAAGLLAREMGLPVKKFLAATNENDVVPRFMETGEYAPAPAVPTISNAMDVGNPSNWVRIMQLFKGRSNEFTELFFSQSGTDADTLEAIAEIYEKNGYLACPHTALAWRALKSIPNEEGLAKVFLATAHPCKFPSVYQGELKEKIQIPEAVKGLYEKTFSKISLGNDYAEFRDFLLGNL